MNYWWQREDLFYQNQQLYFAGNPISSYLEGFDTPLFLYSGSRISANIERLQKALKKITPPIRLLYAMKANRNCSVLHHIRNKNLGIDACSPGEVKLALSYGFKPSDISLTGILSPQELRKFASIEELTIHADSLKALETIGASSPGRKVGIRINPQSKSGSQTNPLLNYSNAEQISKFGIYKSEIPSVLKICDKFDLIVNSIHMHLGCGLLNDGLEALTEAMNKARDMIDSFKHIEQINLGGGLGVPHSENENALDLEEWASVIQQSWGDINLPLLFEPGEYLLKDAGILLLSTNYQEEKNGKLFTYLNGGFNLAMEPAFYSLPCHPISLTESQQMVTSDIVGNINEALDIWMSDVSTPRLKEGDTIALINAGTYAAAMASNHCMRGDFNERFIL